MSTTRRQKRRNNQQEVVENVSEGFVSPVLAENSCSLDQDVVVVGPSKPKSPRIENSVLETLRVSLKEEITSEIKSLLMESQREMLKLSRSETGENVRNSTIDETENETRSFHTPTKTVRINSTSNHDSDTFVSRNTGLTKGHSSRLQNIVSSTSLQLHPLFNSIFSSSQVLFKPTCCHMLRCWIYIFIAGSSTFLLRRFPNTFDPYCISNFRIFYLCFSLNSIYLVPYLILHPCIIVYSILLFC